MIEIARDIIVTAEAQVAGCYSTPWPWLTRIVRWLVPGMLLARGAKDLGRQAARVAVWAVIAALVGFLVPLTEQASRSANVAVLVALAGFAALMSTPSDFSRLIDQEAVHQVAQQLSDRGVRTPGQVEALVSAVAHLERRPMARISGFKWMMGVAWAAAVYAFAQTIPAAVEDSVLTQAYLELALWAVVIALLLYVLSRLYSLTTELVFEAVYLGLAEHAFHLNGAES